MLVVRTQPTAVHTLSARLDEEAYAGVKSLADEMGTSPSVIMRVAIYHLLRRQEILSASNLQELMGEKHATN
jgi:predicted transcriptional regulator